MKKILFLVAVLVFGITGMARAAIIFDFEGPYSGVTPISSYMTGVYGDTVNAYATTGSHSWTGNNTTHLSTSPDLRYIFINFTVPITKIYGTTLGYIDDGGNQTDFKMYAYGSDYTVSNNPYTGSTGRIFFQEWSGGDDSAVDIPDINLTSPVYWLIFSDDGASDVFIDNLKVDKYAAVTGVPEPTTMLLLGLGLVGIAGIRRKFRS